VTKKDHPNDLDVLLIMNKDFDLARIPENAKILFNHVQARLKFNADLFWAKESIGEEHLNLWLDTYQTTRDFKRRGIVEVKNDTE